MEIALYHKHYTDEHLAEVKAEMESRGAPVIRAIWSECYEMWMAVEGCHRLRAAKDMGITPIIKNVSNQKTITIQNDGYSVKMAVSELAKDLEDRVWRTATLVF